MDSLVSLIPSGDYKQVDTIYYGNETLGTVTLIMIITSPDKNNFG